MPRRSAFACWVQATLLTTARFGFSRHRFPIGGRQTEVSQNFLVWDGRVMLQPFVRFGNSVPLGIATGVAFVIGNQRFEQTHHG